MDGWENFALAQVGAAAALAGLVLVGVSVNLERVLSEPGATSRVAEALFALLGLLVAASVLLIPGQARWVAGIELLAIGVLGWAANIVVQRRAKHAWVHSYGPAPQRIRAFVITHAVLGELATLPFVVAGVVLLFGSDDGLYGVAVGAAGAFGLAFLDAWVLLIEINRIPVER
jgi:hypothetical protein